MGERSSYVCVGVSAAEREDLLPLVQSTILSLLTGETRDYKLNSTLKKNSVTPYYALLRFQGEEK